MPMKLTPGRLVATIFLSAGAVQAKPCADPAAVVRIRQAAEARCPCAAATRRHVYMACVARVAREAVVSGGLSPSCATAVRSCAHRSVCGRPERVICCRSPGKGRTACGLRRSSSACLGHGPKGGHSYLSPFPSVCDACPDGDCGTTTSTTLGVSAMAEDCGSMLITWSNPDVSVSVSRSTDSTNWTTVLRASSIGQATFRDTGLAPLTSYHYRVTPLPRR